MITSIALFAIIGATINAGVGYWVVFTLYVIFRLTEGILKFIQACE